MVTENTLRTREGGHVFKFSTAGDPNKCLMEQIILTCANFSELPSTLITNVSDGVQEFGNIVRR